MARLLGEHESNITEMFETMGHFGVILLAFLFVIMIFLWKEGTLRGPKKDLNDVSKLPSIEPTVALKDVPQADVGMRMIFDQANGELGTGSARIASSSALPDDTDPPESSSANTPALDLEGPWSCATSTTDGSASLYIESNKVKFALTTDEGTQSVLLSGDCLYSWQESMGTKQCGFGEYLGLFATLLPGAGDVDIASIIEEQLVGDEAQMKVFQSLRATCQKQSVQASVFQIPQDVDWQEDASSDSQDDSFGILEMFQ